MNQDFDGVGRAFVNTYYESFDANRANLAPLYANDSMLTFEGQQFQGTKAIVEKLVSLPFQLVKHILTTIDCQPSPGNGVLVLVMGQLKTDSDPPHTFTQTFHLVMNAQGSYFVFNDIFRLALHNA